MLKKLCWEAFGFDIEMLQATMRPLNGTTKGFDTVPALDWKPVTLPTASQGDCGQAGGGVVCV